MFTTFDKAIVAFLTGLLAVLDVFFGLNFGLDEGTIAGLAGVLAPILVYLVPNKKRYGYGT